jgi:hypothetical protein
MTGIDRLRELFEALRGQHAPATRHEDAELRTDSLPGIDCCDVVSGDCS